MPSVFGVMSAFHPDSRVVRNALDHLEQVDRLVIVDDGSPQPNHLSSLDNPRILVVNSATNLGIAAALNVGIKIALSEGADFILNIDQDTTLDPGYVERALSTFTRAAAATKIGLVVSDGVNMQMSIPPKYSPEGFGLVEEAIQSGMVMSARCVLDVGFMDESLFIDCVDTEFCLRVRDFGWNIAVARGANITHELGDDVPFRPFGCSLKEKGAVKTFQYHPPFRRYYIARNNIDLCLRYLRYRPRWVASVVRRELVPHMKALISGPHLRAQWLAITVGIIHGLVRRRGKIPRWLSARI